MKQVMVFGTFDILHEGHKNFFKQAREHGDYLIVIIARDKTVKNVKGSLPRNNENTRLKIVKKYELVNEVFLGELEDKYKLIVELRPDIICLGYDQNYFTEGLKSLNIKIARLKPFKPEIYKSSKIMDHKTVAAVIRQEDKILMIDRAIYPFGWACPAGHVNQGETLIQTLKREIAEETGLKVLKYKLLIHEYIDWNKCSRGVMGHDWHVYEILEWSGRIKQNKREEKNIKWVNIKEVENLKLEKIWEYWFKKLNIL